MKNSLNLCLAILFLMVLGCGCPAKLAELANKGKSPTPSSTPTTNSTPSPTTPTSEYDLTMAKYKQLSIGQPRSEVERILGGRGTEVSSSTGGGVRFSVNKWEDERSRSIILAFRNDKIMSKSQVGLK